MKKEAYCHTCERRTTHSTIEAWQLKGDRMVLVAVEWSCICCGNPSPLDREELTCLI